MHRCTIDDRGEIVGGLFYAVNGGLPMWGLNDDWPGEVVAVDPEESYGPVLVRVHGRKEKNRYECPIDKRHKTGEILESISIEVENGERWPVFTNTENFFVMNDAIEGMKKAGLQGAESIKPDFKVLVDADENIRENLRVMTFPGKWIDRPFRVFPEGADNCPFCGRSPVVCQACGFRNKICPVCDRQILNLGRVIPPDSELINYDPGEWDVLDGARWDGNDFLGGNVITRRALSYFQEHEIGPCEALELRTYLGDCTPEQRKKLSEMAGVSL